MRVHTKIIWDSDGTEILDDFYRYHGPVAHLGGGGGQKQQQQSTQQVSTGPWSAQQPYLTKGFDAALQNYNSDNPSFYPDSTVTPFSSATRQGMGLVQGLADSSRLPGQAAQQVGNTASGGYQTDPQSWIKALTNPAMGQDPNAYIDAVTKSVGRGVTSQVRSDYAGAGRTGDSPIAQQSIARGIADSVAPLQFSSAEAAKSREFQGGRDAVASGMSAYDAERQRQLTAAGMAPSTEAARYAPAEQLMGIGSQQEQKSGQELQDQIDRFNFAQNLPQQKLDDYMGIVGGNNWGQSGTQSGTNITNASSQASGAQTFGAVMQGLGMAAKVAGK